MPSQLVTAPTETPVSIDEVKSNSIIEIDDDDTLIDRYIRAATSKAEAYTKRAFITQTWKTLRDNFDTEMQLPRGQLQSVSSITYIDNDGNSQTLSTSIYEVDADSDPGRVVLAYNQSWPSTRDKINAVTIQFIAGYGNSASSVPEEIRQAIIMMAGVWYDNRSMGEMPKAVENLLIPYRIW